MSDSSSLIRPEGYVEDVLRESEDAQEAIATVQNDNRVRISSMQPAMPILDLHAISRADIHSSLFHALEEQLLARVEALDPRGLTKLLDRCFRFIGSRELRDVCLKIMRRLPEVEEKYLLHISENHALYSACPLEVRQQIWQTNQGFFGEAVSPLLDRYIAEKESMLFSTHDAGDKRSPSFLSLSPKSRRQSAIVQELVHMVGSSATLYKTLLRFLRTLFLRTQVCHYCTLRADLLMTLHERENSIIADDRCHKFAWCLDACIRASRVDDKKSRELYSFLDSLERGNETLGDVSMLLRDPYSLNAICQSILDCLLLLYEQAKLPRDSSELECLLRLLQLGLKAHDIMDSQVYEEDSLDVDVVVKFLPELLSLMVENSLRQVCHKLKEEYSAFTPSKHFSSALSNPTAMHITCTYALHLLDRKELRSLTSLLPIIAQSFSRSEHTQLPDVFLHLLVVGLTAAGDAVREAALQAVIKEFWLPCCQCSEPALLHFCRLLWTLHPRINEKVLTQVLEGVKPQEHFSAVAHEQYDTLVDHISAKQR